jgi:hypothetical protein
MVFRLRARLSRVCAINSKPQAEGPVEWSLGPKDKASHVEGAWAPQAWRRSLFLSSKSTSLKFDYNVLALVQVSAKDSS